MRCIMEAPYFFAEPRASTALFTVDAARSGLAGRTGRAAGDRHVARAEQADIGLAGRVRLDIARAGHRHVERLRDHAVGIDVARPGDADLGRFGGAALDIEVARTRHGEVYALRGELCEDRKSTRLNSSH